MQFKDNLAVENSEAVDKLAIELEEMKLKYKNLVKDHKDLKTSSKSEKNDLLKQIGGIKKDLETANKSTSALQVRIADLIDSHV